MIAYFVALPKIPKSDVALMPWEIIPLGIIIIPTWWDFSTSEYHKHDT